MPRTSLPELERRLVRAKAKVTKIRGRITRLKKQKEAIAEAIATAPKRRPPASTDPRDRIIATRGGNIKVRDIPKVGITYRANSPQRLARKMMDEGKL